MLTKNQKKFVWVNCSNLEFLRNFHFLRIGNISIVRAYHLQVDFHVIGIRPGKICTKWPKLVPPIPRDHCNRVGSGLAVQKIDRFRKYKLLVKMHKIVTKVRPSYDLSCEIFSSFNLMVIFNIASTDIAESQLMLY